MSINAANFPTFKLNSNLGLISHPSQLPPNLSVFPAASLLAELLSLWDDYVGIWQAVMKPGD